jgi:hypothetical protein
MQLANQEAARLNCPYVGTEHILLGLVADGSGVAALVLKSLDAGLANIRKEIEKIVQSGPDMATMGELPQTPRVKKVLEYSMEESRNLNHDYVGTEHMLLGLLREQEGVAAQVLMNFGLVIDDVRNAIVTVLGPTIAGNIRSTKSGASARRDSGSSDSREECPACGAQMIRVLSGWLTSWLCPEERAAIEAGSVILGAGDRRQVPAGICLACAPLWREVHDLALQVYDLQLVKEDAIAEHQFDRAASIRDNQAGLRTRLEALLDRLLVSEPPGSHGTTFPPVS